LCGSNIRVLKHSGSVTANHFYSLCRIERKGQIMKEQDGSLLKLINDLTNEDIIEAIGYPVSLQDKNFKIIYQNKMAKKMIGNHIGKFCYEAFEHSDNVCNKCPLALSFKDGKVHKMERHNPSKKGLIVEITASVIRDSKGEIIAGMEVVKNISRFKQLGKEQERKSREMKEEWKTVKTPKGLLPICASCNKVRDDKDVWTKVDVYIRDHSQSEITHCYCPECVTKHFSTLNETEKHDRRDLE